MNIKNLMIEFSVMMFEFEWILNGFLYKINQLTMVVP